jgi:hypothetical protein
VIDAFRSNSYDLKPQELDPWQENRCWLVMDLARGGDLHNKIFDELNISIKKGPKTSG